MYVKHTKNCAWELHLVIALYDKKKLEPMRDH